MLNPHVRKGCVTPSEKTIFRVDIGYFVQGKLDAPLEGVKLTIFEKKMTQSGSEQLVMSKKITVTNNAFKFGPFRENQKVLASL